VVLADRVPQTWLWHRREALSASKAAVKTLQRSQQLVPGAAAAARFLRSDLRDRDASGAPGDLPQPAPWKQHHASTRDAGRGKNW